MKIKIGKFNFVSKEKKEFELSSYSVQSKFDYFYMDGKEDTLYVNSRMKFDSKYIEYYKFEQELLKKYYILEYSAVINNIINDFINKKTREIFIKNNYTSYELYKDFSISRLKNLNRDTQCSFTYSTAINFDTNKLICKLNGGNSIIFDPYTEKIDNLEELYQRGIFHNEIKAGLILKEIQYKKAPEFIMSLAEINDFLKEKKSVNLVFNDEKKIKVEAEIDDIFNIYNEKINLHVDGNYEFEDLKSLKFNKTELSIIQKNYLDIQRQIIRTTEDRLMLKIEELKSELEQNFSEYEKQVLYIPTSIEECIERIIDIERNNLQVEEGVTKGNKREYPEWYSKSFTNLWQDYERIKILENVNSLEEIKEEAKKTGDNELEKIYDTIKGENQEEECEVL